MWKASGESGGEEKNTADQYYYEAVLGLFLSLLATGLTLSLHAAATRHNEQKTASLDGGKPVAQDTRLLQLHPKPEISATSRGMAGWSLGLEDWNEYALKSMRSTILVKDSLAQAVCCVFNVAVCFGFAAC